MILSCSNTSKLADKIAKETGREVLKYSHKQFADGEHYYRLENGDQEDVTLIGNIESEPVSLFELLALARAVHDSGSSIKSLIIPYMGYARQDKQLLTGEPILASMVAGLINTIECRSLNFISLHSDAVRGFLNDHHEMVGLEVMAGLAPLKPYEIIAAPDRGATERAELVASLSESSPEVIVMPKERYRSDMVRREKAEYEVNNKKVLIVDDMIDTGRTIATAAADLKKQGARKVDVLAVHGVLSEVSDEVLSDKAIDSIFISDTIYHKSYIKKIKVISIASHIAKLL